MTLIDSSITERGFAPASASIALRTIGACPGMQHRPDARIVIGIGLLMVEPAGPGAFAFSTHNYDLRSAGIMSMLDQVQARLCSRAAIISWWNWGSVPKRFVALCDPDRHAGLLMLARDTEDRWRDLPMEQTWHLRQSRACAMPCLCATTVQAADCDAELAMELLPDPEIMAAQLIDEAIAGWRAWACHFGDFDDHDHPAQQALRALDRWPHP